MPDERVTIKIPRTVYERVQHLVDDSGFSSPTELIVYVLRQVLSEPRVANGGRGREPDDTLTRREILAVRKRLRTLGYLD